MTTQFHKDVFLPEEIVRQALSLLVQGNGRFELTRHAAERVREKGIRLPSTIPFQRVEVVEVTKVGPRIDKFLIRFCHGDENDVCMSVGANGRVPTCWLNSKTDRHETLNRRQYIGG
jgi:hypothetical protein